MLDGGSLASHHSPHVGRHSLAVSHCKSLVVDVSVGQALKGLQYLHLTLLKLSDVCYTEKGVLFLSLSGSGSGRGNLSIYVKGLPAVLEGVGRLVCLTGFTN